MKKIIIFLLPIVMANTSFGQQAKTSQPFAAENYLKKSKNQKKAANILMIGGAACIATAILIPKGEVTNPGFILTTEYKNDGIRGTFLGVGILSMLSSVPFYLLSAKNQRKASAATVSLNNQKVFLPHQNVFVFRTQVAVTFKLKLG
ncbi:MAG: hypothetical protein ABIO05_05745 [Ferruginibacter sp.]